MGNMCVSPCRCCVLLSVVYPVAILSAVFCVICCLYLILVVAIWWKRTRVWVLLWLFYVTRIVSFCFSHAVVVSVLCICIVSRVFVVVLSICLLYVSSS